MIRFLQLACFIPEDLEQLDRALGGGMQLWKEVFFFRRTRRKD